MIQNVQLKAEDILNKQFNVEFKELEIQEKPKRLSLFRKK